MIGLLRGILGVESSSHISIDFQGLGFGETFNLNPEALNSPP